ncbi:conjugal transfer mating pair stabilization protein TraN [Shewanella morhuae]|uniref:Conjugal transfer mating pair stabilization protein TraN n=2 Tax=Shewanella morhuae TaxID=365591 RepID=A0A380BSW4_9GAMM|nr:conjugal transfer mating pair stabilization protein TraN [Shewanella morhuae]SUJ07297.1 conjugal transfer mating pair stabilization protein TraN [Shewanella morhuae]
MYMNTRISAWRAVCVYFTSFCMLGGGLHWAFFFTLVTQIATFDVYAANELKIELDTKYQLDKAKNVDGTDLFNKIMENKDKGSGATKDIEVEILSRPSGAGTPLDFSEYQEVDFHKEFEQYMGEGIPQGKPKVPTMSNGDINVEYYEKAGVKFTRDEKGNLVTTTIDTSERGAKNTTLKSNEAFTNQQDRPDEEFNAPSNYGNEQGYIDDLKVQYKKTSNGKTVSSEAYRAIMQGNAVNPAPKLKSNSYFLQNSNLAISDAQQGKGIWSSSCVDSSETKTEVRHIPVWEPAICVQPNHQNFDHCKVTKRIESNGNIYKESKAASFGYEWGTYLTVEVDFKNGTASVIPLSDPVAGITTFAADIEPVDYYQICEANSGFAKYISSGYWEGNPVGGKGDTSIRYVVVEMPSCKNGMVAKLQVEDTNHTNDRKHNLTATFKFEFQTTGYTEVYEQSPAACADMLGWKPGPYPCDGCYKPATPKDDFCHFDEWEVIEQSTREYPQWVIETLNPMFDGDPNPEHIYDAQDDGTGGYRVGTWKINAKGYSCDPLKGNEYCAAIYNPETNEFNQKCLTYEELKETTGTCDVYKDNPRCEKTGTSCAEGWYDNITEICYMYSDDYRCDVSEPIEITKTKTTNVCASMLPCMGNDCAYGKEESSDDFEKAVLMASIAQSVEDDATCATTDPSTCEIFPGESEYCSWEVSGMGNNCCDAPSGINYLEMAAMGYKMMQTETFKNVSSTLSGGVTDQIGGLYTDFTSMLVDGWNSGATAVVDFASSMMGDPEFMQGAVDAITVGGETATDGIVSSLMHKMQQQLYNFLNDLLPDALADMMFQEATDQMVQEGVAQAGDVVLSSAAETFLSVLSFVGLIYTIYNVVKILANLLTQCDKNEQDMGVKLAQKQCFAVGSKYCAKKVLGVCYLRRQDWCCYSSMLSRIIADQGSKQLGKDMSSCPGFTIEEFGRIDFDKLDLDEWLSTMYQADILSTSGYDIERLTGDGRMYGNLTCDDGDLDCIEMNRKNANERALEQFEGDADGAANQLKDTFDPNQIDCSVYPRPIICEIGKN